MGKFAGWNFLGNFALSIYLEGINMVLNLFGGVVANAAQSISTQVSKGLSSVSERMATAFAPQATTQYAVGQMDSFNNLIILSAKIINYVYLIMAIPMAIFTEWIIELWLGEIPQYSIEFVRVILIYGLARTVHSPLNLGFICSGKLKSYQIIEICILVAALPMAYILLKLGLPLYWSLMAMVISNTVNNIAILFLARQVWKLRVKNFVTQVLIPIFIIIFTNGLLSSLIMHSIDNRCLQMTLVITATAVSIFFIGLNATERRQVISLLKRKFE
jgi:O-antigen/teichoic acid export membrane protein